MLHSRAARRLYASEGLEVSMASVAREAGVGKATLSRRFATRDELVNAVFTDRMEAYAAATKAALGDPDPWHGFTHYVETICGMQAADRGFAAVLTVSFPGATAAEARRTESYRGFLELISRAKATGHLRADFTSEDLVILLMATPASSPPPATPHPAPGAGSSASCSAPSPRPAPRSRRCPAHRLPPTSTGP
ncbi:helix-turn-helix domain-containing protein [Amycolatopsis sp. NPDC051128]|uniref:TetR/AcrR family transcriptional regulator n=1 Tax=Amycolatopsis sp. NPDC051128 TaxID=3155412 RepID=UPI0034430E8A